MTAVEGDVGLDDVDKRLLDAVQRDFPVEARPFRVLAKGIGLTEQDALERIRALNQNGFIREMGAVFDLRRLGYTSTLCAAQVAPDTIRAVAALINSFREVTHNYLREHVFNLWFTVIAPSAPDIERILECLRSAPGVLRVLSLPQKRMFKIQVHFPTHSRKVPEKAPAGKKHKTPDSPPVFQDGELRLLRILSDPLPLTEEPFAAVAARAGVGQETVMDRIRCWIADGTIRRFGARIAHQAVGYAANGMSVWRVSPEAVESAASYMTAQPEVSHCYLRDAPPDWRYNMYAMIHGAARENVEAVARRIAEHTGISDYAVLFSTEELKKSAPRYFSNNGA